MKNNRTASDKKEEKEEEKNIVKKHTKTGVGWRKHYRVPQ